ncbi:hypothetical protein [Brevibacillus reuszeri]|uniref:Uncharacterized protein n=2 Tax=Brevibacillus reuszeri TaxID=54915 RepID=A0A0K9YL44_9BACL|nr:hypothetical protein [Brevibacillus reuszeri]KNB69468.1 hypothetical protein ADS79_26675 [Brevibacillus reuszeri]MED1861551.1 hypothetical protein [Brevibacillus reuszeri]
MNANAFTGELQYFAVNTPGMYMVVGIDQKPEQSWFIDDDGDSLTYTVTSSKSDVVDVMIGHESYTDIFGQLLTDTRILVTAKTVGTSVITLTADDGKGGIKSVTFDIEVI